MTAYEEFTGKTVEEALRKARDAFGAGLDDLDFEILTPGSRGVLGMGAEPARIVAAPRAALGGAAPKREAAAQNPLPAPPPRERTGPGYGDRSGSGAPGGYGDRGRGGGGYRGGQGGGGGGGDRDDRPHEDRGPREDRGYGDRGRAPGGGYRDDRPREDRGPRPGGTTMGGQAAASALGATRAVRDAERPRQGAPGGQGGRPERGYGDQGRQGGYQGGGQRPDRGGQGGGGRPDRGPRPDRAARPEGGESRRTSLTASELAELTAARGANVERDDEASEASPEALAAGQEILSELMRHLGFDVKVEIETGDTSRLNVVGDGDEKEALGALIGRKGERLSALQHLVNLMLSRRMDTWTRVLVDVEDYRGRRERQLRDLATRAAERVSETGKMLQLEPMPALERRWIHIALRDHPQVATQSIGEEPNRRVVVVPRSI
jgi:spoIIIJ-associated protein